jgi:FkbM family methyltransferase
VPAADALRPPAWLRRAPLVRQPLRRLSKRHAPEGPVMETVEGLTWRLAPRDNKVDFDIWYKRRLEEAPERAFLARHLCAGDLFVDIGANIGGYTIPLLAAVPGLRAVAFEPLERLRLRLLHNLALNGLAARAEVRAEAVGPQGSLTLYESGNAGRSSLIPFAGARVGQGVPVRPLATLLSAAPAAMKVDVEGFEDRAILPWFDETPPHRWPRAVVIETLHRDAWQRDCLQELFERGYVQSGRTEENALLHLSNA